ncbi:ArsR/SmtB family transcription factor [Chondromyces crocatus]|uniref:ArsR family transcriptional regulator n=1 Tax=Chondromyces crocatus TaxID=52 RepID=A0A0K1EKM8_CHOCO|nr:metalloregulator ArsR/SmtB family transcription factor [Chondromyces crocatus]AKT41406.1 ArsR family transcriptional regulator [Chondromyces crocatus]
MSLHPDSSPSTADAAARCELYKLLAEPVRLRLLGLAAAEELAVGELAELLREGQPKVSRHAAALREAGLLLARRQGTWTLLRLAPDVQRDPVVDDAVRAGTRACEADGTMARIADLLAGRDQETRDFFARGGRPVRAGAPSEVASYIAALAPLIPHRLLAIDAGTGDGALLEVLGPIFHRVVAIDRSAAQLELARERARRRELHNVDLVCDELDGLGVRKAIARALGQSPSASAGADVVFAARMLHHAPQPLQTLRALARLARAPKAGERGGAVCVLDYEAHDDLLLREQEADVWLGFEPKQLRELALEAGLVDIEMRQLPAAWQGEGPDRHLTWQLLVGFRSDAAPPTNEASRTP